MGRKIRMKDVERILERAKQAQDYETTIYFDVVVGIENGKGVYEKVAISSIYKNRKFEKAILQQVTSKTGENSIFELKTLDQLYKIDQDNITEKDVEKIRDELTDYNSQFIWKQDGLLHTFTEVYRNGEIEEQLYNGYDLKDFNDEMQTNSKRAKQGKELTKKEIKEIVKRGESIKDYTRYITLDLEKQDVFKNKVIFISIDYKDGQVIQKEYSLLETKTTELENAKKLSASEVIDFIINFKPIIITYEDSKCWREEDKEYQVVTKTELNAEKEKTLIVGSIDDITDYTEYSV